ncbi:MULTISPECIES: ubiquinol oxidase subunit II [unclassified Saccharibacter]|uniref:ubiquinol oxidase subunit II n=1 Tax=unclassified Saccharibacter TaxID=2648722 RepID=UPI001EF02848|nr:MULTISPECIES: ubiquinol oxidase subunit II [unclassified Saccharibacter]
MKRLWRFFPALPALMLSGCTVDLLQPGGPIGEGNRDMMVLEFAVMMCVVVPTCIATLVIAWKYRAANTKAEYKPKWAHSNVLEVFIWGIPVLIIAVLSCINFWSTHYYDPYKPLAQDMLKREHAENTKPLEVQVVSLDWKWLFIYPEQGIATINELDVPTKTPLDLHITSDSVMTSFFIPQLGSQIYSMAGMETRLHLLARKPGSYRGEAAQYTGPGFSGMKFRAIAMPQEQFASWVENVRTGTSQFAEKDALDEKTYRRYATPPAVSNEVAPAPAPVTYFSNVQSALFQHIIAKYNNGMARDANGSGVMHMDMQNNGANGTSSATGM